MSTKQKKDKLSTGGKRTAVRMIPKLLLGIHFDDLDMWMKAYRQYKAEDVSRAVLAAFRRRYMMSQKDAAEKIGISESTFNHWERGLSVIRWTSKRKVIGEGWFHPAHFGLDKVEAEEFSEAKKEEVSGQ